MQKFLVIGMIFLILIGFSLTGCSPKKKEQPGFIEPVLEPVIFPNSLDKGLDSVWYRETTLEKLSEEELVDLLYKRIIFLNSCREHSKLKPIIQKLTVDIIIVKKSLDEEGDFVILYLSSLFGGGIRLKSEYKQAGSIQTYNKALLKKELLADEDFRPALIAFLQLTNEDIFNIIAKELGIKE